MTQIAAPYHLPVRSYECAKNLIKTPYSSFLPEVDFRIKRIPWFQSTVKSNLEKRRQLAFFRSVLSGLE